MTGAALDDLSDDQVGDAVRERVYAAITGLATVVTLYQYSGDTSALSAAASLLTTMLGLFAASLIADLIAHSTVRGDAPTRDTRRHMTRVAGQALEVAWLPELLILLSGTGVWTLRNGLVLSAVALGVTQLGLVVWGLRRSRMSVPTRLRFLLFEAVAIVVVVGIKLVAH